ncbi:luciferin sulfotransferase-like isoform X2 [Macrobrachium rosenbergii]|uniref:luciferin sulfotransferase-like isoform X2 n=1 Tax=Macrobrachium rosenbergii TaxID=79674 RepID=UPI0034D46E7C
MVLTRYKSFANIIYNFKYRRDDICLFTFPKSGTVWTAGIIWAMTHIGELERAMTESLNSRVFYVDNDFVHSFKEHGHREKLKNLCPDAKEEDGLVLQLAALEKGRRLIWSHLPFDLQNPDVLDECKVVSVMRHPKDNLFSRYVFNNKFGSADLQFIVETFLTGRAVHGSYWHHVNETWKRRDHPNLHIMFYEDMKADIMSELKKLNVFLGTNLTEDQLKRVAEHTTFNNMKEHPTMAPSFVSFKGSFFHTGQVGSSKGQFPPELDAQVDAWIKENAVKVDPAFRYVS